MEPSPLDTLAERMADAARELEVPPDTPSTLQLAAELAVLNVEGCEAAGISIVRGRGRVESPAHTSREVEIAHQVQDEAGQGPCLDAVWLEETIYAADLSEELRWPTWGRLVVERTGLRSVLSIRSYTVGDTIGALNLFSTRPHAFDDSDRREGLALAAHVAVAIAAAQAIDSLGAALDSRSLIGQAMGITMERFDVDAVRAWALLTRLSSTSQVKMRVLAQHLVDTREIGAHPDDPDLETAAG